MRLQREAAEKARKAEREKRRKARKAELAEDEQVEQERAARRQSQIKPPGAEVSVVENVNPPSTIMELF